MTEHDDPLFDELVRLHAPPASPTPAAGNVGPPASIAGYRVLEELQRGGQGRVFRAVQESTNRVVALKVLLSGVFAGLQQRRRFEREIELVATMQHPGIVTIHDRGTTADGSLFLAMELVEGVPLDEYLVARRAAEDARAGARRRWGDALDLFAAICAAVSHAHQRGVIHRDLKPDNILVDGTGRVRVLDFGLAKALAEDEGAAPPTLTHAGEFVGTFAYASPEQTLGDPNAIDIRSDVYSLGVILYRMLTGRPPYPVQGPPAEVMRAIVETAPAPLHVDSDLKTIVLQSLAKEKERRYQSVDQFARDLERYRRGEPIEARRDSALYVLRKTLARHRLAAGAALAIVIILVIALVHSRLQEEVIAGERDEARNEAGKAKEVKGFLQAMLDSIEPEVAQGRETPVLSAMLAQASRSIEGKFADLPRVEAEIRLTIGKVYSALANREAAEPHLRRAYALSKEALGEEHRDTLEARARLAALLLAHVDPLESGPFVAETLEISDRVLDPEDPLWLGILELRGYHLLGREDFEGALDAFRQRVAASARREGPLHSQTLEARAQVATLLDALGHTVEAAAELEEVLALMREHVGEDWPETLSVANELGLCWIQLGRTGEAQSLLEETLARCRRIGGDEQPLVATLLGNLGMAHARQGNYAWAIELQREVIALHARILSDNHPTTLLAKTNLGVGLARSGQPDEALDILFANLESMRAVHPPPHSDLLFTALELAGVLAGVDQRVEATGILEEVLEAATAEGGDAQPWIVDVLSVLADLYAAEGRADEERALRQRIDAVSGG